MFIRLVISSFLGFKTDFSSTLHLETAAPYKDLESIDSVLYKYEYLPLLSLLIKQIDGLDQNDPRDMLDFHKCYQVTQFDP
jgi:hypothetical protein